MARIAFVHHSYFIKLGVMYLASALKQSGHECRVFLQKDKHLLDELGRWAPDIVAFSSVSGEKKWTLSTADQIRTRFGLKPLIAVGGPLATFDPHLILHDCIDVVCIGEGETAIVELAKAIDRGGGLPTIDNMWLKKEGRIVKCAKIALIQDLDSLNFPDRMLYACYPLDNNNLDFPVMTTRGCPFSCTYCFHHAIRRIYERSGEYLRCRSVNNVLAELREIKRKYGPKRIWFLDNVFLLDINWAREFLARYTADIGVPFICNLRAELIDEERCALLEGTGLCSCVTFGIETGDQDYRIQVLNRKMTDEQIKGAAQLLRKHRLKFSTTNMIALPGETLEQAWKTIRLNREIRPDSAICGIYQPLPATKLYDLCLAEGLIDPDSFEDLSGVTHNDSILRQKDIERVVNLHKFFYLLLYLPQLTPLVRWLIRFPRNKFYYYFYGLGYLFLFRKRLHNLSLPTLLRMGVIGLKHYR